MKKKMKPVFKKFFAGGSDVPTSGDPDPYASLGVMNDPAITGGSSFNWASASDPNAATNPGTAAPAAGASGWQSVFGTASKISSSVAPYVSNIANSFRKPPMPAMPGLVNPVTLPNINLDNARNRISRATHAQDINADRALSPQAAAAVRNANLAKEIEGTSQVSEQEAFLNSRQRTEAAGMNLNVDTMNNAAMNHYRDSIVERNIAMQKEQSANLSNAVDKNIGMQNEQAKRDLDLKKMGVLSQMWKDSGVYDRLLKRLKDQGIDDPTGILTQQQGDMTNGTGTTHEYGGRIYSSGGGAPFKMGGKMRNVFPDHPMDNYFATGGTVPYTKGTDLEFENWYRQNTPEGLAGLDLSETDKDYYSMFRGKDKNPSTLNPLHIPGANPMAYRRPTMSPSYMAEGGVFPTGPGVINTTNVAASKGSGIDDAFLVDHLNSVLSGGKSLGNFDDTTNKLSMQAYLWRQQNPGVAPEKMIQGFYGRPVTAGDPLDATRQRISKIGYGPEAMYSSTPDQTVRHAFGGFTAGSTKPLPMNKGRGTGLSQINPFGRTGGTAFKAAPWAKFNPSKAGLVGSRMYQDGGGMGMDTPDLMFTNGHDTQTSGVYLRGGTMNMPVRPKKVSRVNFAGIEHMAQGGQMGHIPAGAFEEDHINRPRPTPGPDDVTIGMDILGKGGKIHIKKANRGKFTAYKARTGKTTAEALHSSNPHVRQMANFARNAKKWNHAMGGPMHKVFC